jgi:hypothetical protein
MRIRKFSVCPEKKAPPSVSKLTYLRFGMKRVLHFWRVYALWALASTALGNAGKVQ